MKGVLVVLLAGLPGMLVPPAPATAAAAEGEKGPGAAAAAGAEWAADGIGGGVCALLKGLAAARDSGRWMPLGQQHSNTCSTWSGAGHGVLSSVCVQDPLWVLLFKQEETGAAGHPVSPLWRLQLQHPFHQPRSPVPHLPPAAADQNIVCKGIQTPSSNPISPARQRCTKHWWVPHPRPSAPSPSAARRRRPQIGPPGGFGAQWLAAGAVEAAGAEAHAGGPAREDVLAPLGGARLLACAAGVWGTTHTGHSHEGVYEGRCEGHRRVSRWWGVGARAASRKQHDSSTKYNGCTGTLSLVQQYSVNPWQPLNLHLSPSANKASTGPRPSPLPTHTWPTHPAAGTAPAHALR